MDRDVIGYKVKVGDKFFNGYDGDARAVYDPNLAYVFKTYKEAMALVDHIKHNIKDVTGDIRIFDVYEV